MNSVTVAMTVIDILFRISCSIIICEFSVCASDRRYKFYIYFSSL